MKHIKVFLHELKENIGYIILGVSPILFVNILGAAIIDGYKFYHVLLNFLLGAIGVTFFLTLISRFHQKMRSSWFDHRSRYAAWACILASPMILIGASITSTLILSLISLGVGIIVTILALIFLMPTG